MYIIIHKEGKPHATGQQREYKGGKYKQNNTTEPPSQGIYKKANTSKTYDCRPKIYEANEKFLM